MINDYKDEYRNYLIKKSIIKILIVSIIILIGYISLKILSTTYTIKSYQNNQISKLLKWSTNCQIIAQDNKIETIILLNTLRQIYSINNTFYGNLSCNNQRYLCQFTDSQLISVLDVYYQLINQTLIGYTSSPRLLIIIESSTSKKIVYNFDKKKVLLKITPKNINSITQFLIKLSTLNYISKKIIINNDNYRIDCGSLKVPFIGKICIIKQIKQINVTAQTNIEINNIEIVNLNYPQQSSSSLYKLIQKYLYSRLTSHNSKVLIQLDMIKECIENNLSTNKDISLITCYHSRFLHILKYPIYMTHFNIYAQPAYYQDLIYSNEAENQYQEEYYILSDLNYFLERDQIILDSINQIQLTAKIMLIIVGIWTCSLSYSVKYVQSIIVPAIDNIKNMVEILNSNENNIEYKSKLNELIHNCSSINEFKEIIKYFEMLNWSRQIIDQKGNTKKKKLIQGINLFNSPQYFPVLNYIYSQIINLQQKRIEKLKTLRYFPKKYQHSIKIIPFESLPISYNLTPQLKQKSIKIYKQSNNNKQLEKSPFQDKLKSKRLVRFSHEPKDQGTKIIKKSKFAMRQQSQSSIRKQSQKSIDNSVKARYIQQQSKKQTKISQINININKCQNESKKQIPFEFKSQEFIDNYNCYKFDLTTQENQQHQQIQNLQIYKYSFDEINAQIRLSYLKIINYYNQLINVKKLYMQQNMDQFSIKSDANQLYKLQIEKLRYIYKNYKHNKQYSYQPIQSVPINFKNLSTLQDLYDIDRSLFQKAILYKMKIYTILNYPISYRQLQKLCQSQNEIIKAEARYLFAKQFFRVELNLGFEIVLRICDNLVRIQQIQIELQTQQKYKRKSLLLLQNIISKNQSMNKQLQNLTLVRKFYNYKNKKFYFIADFSQSYDIFSPFIKKIYTCMDHLDLSVIFNLAQGQIQSDTSIVSQDIKPKKLQNFEELFQQINVQNSKLKSRASTKTLNRKFIYQKVFNDILEKIQSDNTQFSKYLIILLGGDGSSSSSMVTDQAQSLSLQNNRQLHQVIHGQISKKMQKNYFHVILVGQNLNNYQTRQGKLKKHAKLGQDLLQIDLNRINSEKYNKQIDRYFYF